MLLKLLFFYGIAARACTIDSFGYWIVKYGETTDMVAECLQVSSEEIGHLNEDRGMVVGSIRPNQKWKVPIEPACPSASWRTQTLTAGGSASCVAFLEMTPATTFVTSTERSSAYSGSSNGGHSTTSGEQPRTTDGAHSTIAGEQSSATSGATNSGGASSLPSNTQGQSGSSKNTASSTDTKDVPSSTQASVNTVTSAGTTTTSASVTAVSTGSAPTSSVTDVSFDRRCFHQDQDFEFFNPGEDYKTNDQAQNIFAGEFCKAVGEHELRDYEPFHFSKTYAGGGGRGYSFSLAYLDSKKKCKKPGTGKMDVTYCQGVMRDNYLKCDNGGLGGVQPTEWCWVLTYKPVNLVGASIAVVPTGVASETGTGSSNPPTSIATNTNPPTSTATSTNPPTSTAATSNPPASTATNSKT